MPDLSIREIDDGTYQRLKARASEHGVSLEEEARRLLASSVASKPERTLDEIALECFGPEHGVDLELPPRRPHEPIDFSG